MTRPPKAKETPPQRKNSPLHFILYNQAVLLICDPELGLNLANSLLEQLFETNNPYNCAHGRPTIIKFSSYDLDKMFKRAMT